MREGFCYWEGEVGVGYSLELSELGGWGGRCILRVIVGFVGFVLRLIRSYRKVSSRRAICFDLGFKRGFLVVVRI